MTLPARKHPAPMTVDEFLAWEIEQDDRYEFFRGEVSLMTGARQTHNVVTLNLAVALHNRLDPMLCRVLSNSMKVRIDAADAVFYPDVVVSCSRNDRAQEHALIEPVLIAEVLSPSTGSFDKNAKFAAYRRMPRLTEYLLVEPRARVTELFRRSSGGDWTVIEMGAHPVLELASIDLSIPLDDLFVGLDE
jgi:Uma2 family endonuclease